MERSSGNPLQADRGARERPNGQSMEIIMGIYVEQVIAEIEKRIDVIEKYAHISITDAHFISNAMAIVGIQNVMIECAKLRIELLKIWQDE